jgi:HEPN domain-containing protein
MDFTSEHYYQASIERIRQAQELYFTPNSFALSMYVAGVAVESMLRAYLLRKKTEFESRHDVMQLLTESGILDVDPDILRGKGLSEEQIENHSRSLESAVKIVSVLWHNNYRYAS